MKEPEIWANISHACHCIDPDSDQVIFHDNDFEIFIDTDGSNHHYKEFEINAKNQTWILMLDKVCKVLKDFLYIYNINVLALL